MEESAMIDRLKALSYQRLKEVATAVGIATYTVHPGTGSRFHKRDTILADFKLALKDAGLAARIDATLSTSPAIVREIEPEKGGIEGAIEAIVKRILGSVTLPTTTTSAPVEIIVRDRAAVRELTGAVLPECFQTIVDLAAQRLNTLLAGPTGCGKTHVAHLTAEALGLRFATLSCSAGLSEAQFTGWLLPSKGGEFEYTPSLFVDFYEHGGVFLIDEIDAADANTLCLVNAALANGTFSIPIRRDNPIARRHEDFVCLAAANTWGSGPTAMYVGRNQLDLATLNRFTGRVLMDYDTKVEESIALPDILVWGRKIREKIDSLGMKRVLSTRTLADLSKMRQSGWSMDQCAALYFADWTKDEISRVS